MTKQVVTRDKVEEARAELAREGLTLSIDRILGKTGGSKTTVARLNREIEEDMATSLKLGADLPPQLVGFSIDVIRKILAEAIIHAERRHEEERAQFRLSLQGHAADRASLETSLKEVSASLQAAHLEAAANADRLTQLQVDLDRFAQRNVELDSELKEARLQSDGLQKELRQLEQYRSVSLLLQQAEETSRRVALSPHLDKNTETATHDAAGVQLDIETYQVPEGHFI